MPSHVEESESPIAPLELKLLCDFCIDSHNVYELNFWKMVLIFVHVFLSGVEIMDLGFFSLMEENAIHSEDRTIAGLFVQNLGKSEKQKSLTPVTIKLGAMPTHHWLYPVKKLLLVRIFGHNSGHFFMNNDTIIGFSACTDESKYVWESIKHPKCLEDFQYFLLFIVNCEARLG